MYFKVWIFVFHYTRSTDIVFNLNNTLISLNSLNPINLLFMIISGNKLMDYYKEFVFC